MADDTPQLTPDQVEVFAQIVDQARRNYGGLDIKIEAPDSEGHRDFWYTTDALNISGTAATFPTGHRITRLEITPADEDGELTAGLMKYVPLGAITASLGSLLNLERAEAALASVREPLPDHSEASALIREAVAQAKPTARQPRQHHGGREPLTDELLRDVAILYLMETRPGQPKKPLGRMAAQYGKPEETVRTWIARARKDGWLGPALKGRAGSEPGPRLLAEAAQLTVDPRRVTWSRSGNWGHGSYKPSSEE